MLAISGSACGGNNDDDGAGTGDGGTPTASGLKATDLAIDLSESGLTVAESGRVPGSTEDQDTYYAIYGATRGAVTAVRLEVNMQPSADEAATQYKGISEALRNPPPDLFGPNATQQDNDPAFAADQSKSYVTANADPAGNRVYTDAYRFGPAVVIVYVIANDEQAARDIRTEVAETVSARMG